MNEEGRRKGERGHRDDVPNGRMRREKMGGR